MRLSLSPRLLQLCVLCNESVEDHAEGCLYRLQAHLLSQKCQITCPVCHQQKVDVNTGDFYECVGCNTQFSTGLLVPEDASKLTRVVLMDWKNDTTIPALQLTQKGQGQMKLTIALQRVDSLIEKALKCQK